MSAQAGVFYFDGRPVDPEIVSALGRSLDEYGPDGGGQFVQPGLVMVQRALHITPQDRLERQPFRSRRGNVMTWDGRLDNREDLLLQLWHERNEEITDVALAMGAYEKWGPDGFARLIGDWSLVVWDAQQQAMVMASDYMGVRPLHYFARQDFVSWSTTLECLVHLHRLYDEIEPRFLVGYLASARPAGVTPYKGLLAVETAQSLTFTRSGAVDVKRFWSIGSPEIRYRDEADYDEHLRTLFLGAVRNRLRSTSPAWAQLSGGLDSSAVVCAADVLVKHGLAAAPDLATISFVSDGSPETDESRFIACVDQQRGRQSHRIQQDDRLDLVDNPRHWITPSQPTYASMQAYELVRRSGGRALLTGVGGDSVMGNFADYHYDVAGLLQHGKPVAALGLARQRALAAKRSIWDVLYSSAFELLPLPFAVRQMVSNTLASYGGPVAVTDKHVAELFHLKRPYAAWWIEEWTAQCTRALAYPDLSQRRAASQVIMMAERRHGQSPSDEPLAFTSHPFLDRPLVEFMLGIPIGIVAPPGNPRGLMRRAFAPFMPPRIVARFSKGYAAPFYMRNTREVLLRWLSRPNDLKVLQLEFLDPTRLIPYLATLRDTGKEPELFILLLKIEQWLEAREQHLRAPASGPAQTRAVSGLSTTARAHSWDLERV
jgi:asparagine synthase (glutamine-hydrolysing)